MGKNRDRASRQGVTSEMQAFQPVSLFASARDRVRVARTGVGQAAVEVDGAVGPGEAHGLAGGGAGGGSGGRAVGPRQRRHVEAQNVVKAG